jgi:flagellar hook-length control protein FliK
MSAMPDLLLQAAPEVKSKAKQPATAPQTSSNESSSFDKVYAKERQTQSGERTSSVKKPAEQRTDDSREASTASSDTPAEESSVATNGNSLPAEAASETAEPVQPAADAQDALDPLLAMALGGLQVPQPEAVPLPEATTEPEPLLITGMPVTTPALAEQETSLEADLFAEQASPTLVTEDAVSMQLPQTVDGKPQQQPTNGKDFAANLVSAFDEMKGGDKGSEPSLELLVEDASTEALQSLKESTQPERADQFVSKLNALTQAINQQSGGVQRVPLVPGQPVAVQQSGWTDAVVDKVMWMSSQNLKSAEIQLDPAELGRLEVRVHLSQDSAQVTFASPNAGVRDALEGQMNRLRDLFAQQGMNLADANVSDQSLNRGWQGQGQNEGRGGSSRGDSLLDGDDLVSSVQEVRSERLSMGRGLVDYYA